MSPSNAISLLLLLVACAHEFVWQRWPDELQGDIRNITAWPLTAGLCFLVALLSGWQPRITAACAAIAVMAFTTAGCSLAWVISPWPVLPGAEQCSQHWGPASMLLSCIAALLALQWSNKKNGR